MVGPLSAPLVGDPEVLVELLGLLVEAHGEQDLHGVLQAHAHQVLALILLQPPLETKQPHLLLCRLKGGQEEKERERKSERERELKKEIGFRTSSNTYFPPFVGCLAESGANAKAALLCGTLGV